MSKPRKTFAHDSGDLSKEDVARILGVTRAAVFDAEKRFLRKVRDAVMNDQVLRQLVIDRGYRVPARATQTGATP